MRFDMKKAILLISASLIVLNFMASVIHLHTKNSELNNTWQGLSDSYRERAELLPNYLQLVKLYMPANTPLVVSIEKQMQTARQANSSFLPANDKELRKAEEFQSELTDLLARFSVARVQYPALMANEGFIRMSQELADKEQKIDRLRGLYNRSAHDFNLGLKGSFARLANTAVCHYERKTLLDGGEGVVFAAIDLD